MLSTFPSAAQYLQNRSRDLISLSHDIQESKGDLGYVMITSPITLLLKGEELAFDCPASLRAFILKKFW